jgi:hypothetical protein
LNEREETVTSFSTEDTRLAKAAKRSKQQNTTFVDEEEGASSVSENEETVISLRPKIRDELEFNTNRYTDSVASAEKSSIASCRICCIEIWFLS